MENNQKASAGWLILGLFVPLAGFIIWLACKKSSPDLSKKAGLGCLIGVITVTVITVATFLGIWFRGYTAVSQNVDSYFGL